MSYYNNQQQSLPFQPLLSSRSFRTVRSHVTRTSNLHCSTARDDVDATCSDTTMSLHHSDTKSCTDLDCATMTSRRRQRLPCFVWSKKTIPQHPQDWSKSRPDSFRHDDTSLLKQEGDSLPSARRDVQLHCQGHPTRPLVSARSGGKTRTRTVNNNSTVTCTTCATGRKLSYPLSVEAHNDHALCTCVPWLRSLEALHHHDVTPEKGWECISIERDAFNRSTVSSISPPLSPYLPAKTQGKKGQMTNLLSPRRLYAAVNSAKTKSDRDVFAVSARTHKTSMGSSVNTARQYTKYVKTAREASRKPLTVRHINDTNPIYTFSNENKQRNKENALQDTKKPETKTETEISTATTDGPKYDEKITKCRMESLALRTTEKETTTENQTQCTKQKATATKNTSSIQKKYELSTTQKKQLEIKTKEKKKKKSSINTQNPISKEQDTKQRTSLTQNLQNNSTSQKEFNHIGINSTETIMDEAPCAPDDFMAEESQQHTARSEADIDEEQQPQEQQTETIMDEAPCAPDDFMAEESQQHTARSEADIDEEQQPQEQQTETIMDEAPCAPDDFMAEESQQHTARSEADIDEEQQPQEQQTETIMDEAPCAPDDFMAEESQQHTARSEADIDEEQQPQEQQTETIMDEAPCAPDDFMAEESQQHTARSEADIDEEQQPQEQQTETIMDEAPCAPDDFMAEESQQHTARSEADIDEEQQPQEQQTETIMDEAPCAPDDFMAEESQQHTARSEADIDEEQQPQEQQTETIMDEAPCAPDDFMAEESQQHTARSEADFDEEQQPQEQQTETFLGRGPPAAPGGPHGGEESHPTHRQGSKVDMEKS
ncbi:T. brucei spp.-specific protein [Trypanosoma brucei gambiense DAL972]|uniref:T. brucei spp.-specific protein n=1 Tax=Trypanosoma brucei gambiense (strain MHOM/CI/86/DAL972) TaxID=679716 RepID=C9ZIB4_TRYB9|nr:T. brucei spp.-specific protein [Trypanosoma brucei gambiense DAL972]CBH08906.1 T. brucei spp.-specific protein [Trypanosoma brucei gambiense DAL972]|eukprot:XP_011771347.1 T. brucei spp.-specific protein [Trypanosoma brucei gambiense DAL972]